MAKPSVWKNRVRQYFQSSRNKGVKIEQMVTHIRRFEYIVTDSELEALVLECNLIKEYRPKYNTMLVDDKTYPFIKVTVQEPFPRIMMVRRQAKDKAKYFWTIYEFSGGEGYHRHGEETLPAEKLRQDASKRHRKRTAMSVLSH